MLRRHPLATLAALLLVGATALVAAPVAAARAQQPLTCTPVNAAHTGDSTLVDTIYVVTGANGANVRNQHSTSGCIIKVAGHNSNVVVVPLNTMVNGQAYAPFNDGTYTWVLVAYFQGNCRDCSNIDWAHTGWVANFNLGPLSRGYTCIVSPSCSQGVGNATYSGRGYGSKTGVVAQPGAGGTSNCYPNLEPYFSQQDPINCVAVVSATTLGPAYNTTDIPPAEYWIGAYDFDPNWFEYLAPSADYPHQDANYYWEYDWWAH